MSVAPAGSGPATGPAPGGPPAPAPAGASRAAFERVRRAFFDAATASGGVVERTYAVAGLPVLLRFAGPALLPAITPALAHLIRERRTPAGLTVHLWDSASTGVPIPPPPAADGARASARNPAAGPIYSAFQPEPQSLSLVAPERREAHYWVPDAHRLSIHERAAPLRWILHRWLRDQGRQMAHAGAVGTRTAAVVLAGPSGAGKSTTALACLARGLDYLGDDYVALAPGPQPAVYSLYSAAKLNADDLAALPHLAPLVENRAHLPKEKALMFLNGRYPAHLRDGLPARAILVVQVRGGTAARVVDAPPGEALRALAPSTIIQLVGSGLPALQAIARFLEPLPCFRLELGGHPTSAADAVADLLARL